MDDQQDIPRTSNSNDIYPTPSRGDLSDDHISYAKPTKWSGHDPDKHMTIYFILFLVILCGLIFFAIKFLVNTNSF